MKTLWERGEATVADVQADLKDDRPIAHNTVATVLSRLVNDGVLSVRRDGRTNVYRPVVAETAVKRTMVSNLLSRLFEGNASALVHHLVSEGELNPQELEDLARLVADNRSTKPTKNSDSHDSSDQ